jgi:hypothetical protein
MGHGLGALAGLASVAVGMSRWKKAASKSIPVPVVILLTIGAVNVPYQTYKAYQWSS